MMKWWALYLVFFLSCGTAPCSSEAKEKTTSYSFNMTKYGAVSVMAIDVKSGEVVCEKNALQRMTPASLTKVLTTGAALNILGGDYRFSTQFYLKQGGEKVLIIKGGGDPTFGSDRLEETKKAVVFKKIQLALKKEGVVRLDKLIVDESLFKGIQQPSKRTWEDMGNYYGAVPHSLTYRENTFYLNLKSSDKTGAPVRIVSVDPPISHSIKSYVTGADNNKDSAYIYGNAQMKEWYVSGTIPRDRKSFRIKGALPNPGLTFATELKQYLNANNIEVADIENTNQSINVESAKCILSHYSPKLEVIAAVVNKRSHNLFADHLLFAIAQQQNEQASWDAGTNALIHYWDARIENFSGNFYDGSGLSPFNKINARDMGIALKYLHDCDEQPAFKKSLAIAGVDGTLKSMLSDEVYKGQFVGKSGSMNGVLGYCGYLECKSGRTVAFCVLCNNFTESFKEVRLSIEDLLKEIISQN